VLLKMRGVLPKTVTEEETGYLRSADRENEAAVEWFDVVKLSGEYPVREGYEITFHPVEG